MPAIADARRRWTERSGLVLCLENEDGVAGYGEASPLPGYSPDTLDEARDDLEAWLADAGSPTQTMGSPAARFAAQCAVLDCEARSRGVPFENLLDEPFGTRPPPRLSSAGLVPFGGSEKDALARAESLVGEGYGALKLKVGPEDDRVVLLREIRRRWDVSIRLDANQSWPAGEVKERLAAYAALDPPPEFIEEPARFPSPEDAAEAMDGSPIPLALDETLQGASPERVDSWLACDVVRVVVLKPTVLGLERTRVIGRRARQRAIGVVLSHAFEGPIAREAASCLALALADAAPAQGLGAHAGLDAWPAWTSPRCRGRRIEAAAVVGLGALDELWVRLG